MKEAKLNPSLNRTPEKVETVHMIGIGGVAMGALAGALKRAGIKVRGSDTPLYPPMSTFLKEQGIDVSHPFDAGNLYPKPDLVIVGNVVTRLNPEAIELGGSDLPYISLPQALAEFFIRDKESIVVAGTHGKTTTTAIIACALEEMGHEPGFMLGGLMVKDGRNFADRDGRFFVVEGDEYDTAFFAKHPKFLYYRPQIGILTSCEFDHVDIYPDMDAVRDAFDSFTSLIPESGALICWGDSAEVLARAEKANCRVITYGKNPENKWRLISASPARNGGMDLIIATPDGELEAHSPLAGEHNALNLTAALAAMAASGLDPALAARAHQSFGGVRRRQQVRGVEGGVVVVDDFAHHPTAVRETVRAVAGFGLPGWRAGQGRLVAVFEPRTNTSKRRYFQDTYVDSFAGADLVLVREPPRVDDVPEEERFSSAELAAGLKARGIEARSFADTASILDNLLAELRAGDMCLIMSNGGFDGLHQDLLNALAAR